MACDKLVAGLPCLLSPNSNSMANARAGSSISQQQEQGGERQDELCTLLRPDSPLGGGCVLSGGGFVGKGLTAAGHCPRLSPNLCAVRRVVIPAGLCV